MTGELVFFFERKKKHSPPATAGNGEHRTVAAEAGFMEIYISRAGRLDLVRIWFLEGSRINLKLVSEPPIVSGSPN